jgi:hypothetical protein
VGEGHAADQAIPEKSPIGNLGAAGPYVVEPVVKGIGLSSIDWTDKTNRRSYTDLMNTKLISNHRFNNGPTPFPFILKHTEERKTVICGMFILDLISTLGLRHGMPFEAIIFDQQVLCLYK